MASPASLATLGNARASPSVIFECSHSVVAVRRIRVVSRVSCRGYTPGRRWSRPDGFVCRCTITTDLIEEKLNVFTPESTFRSSGSAGNGNADDTDTILRPAPKPVLKLRPSITVDPVNTLQWSPAKPNKEEEGDKTAERENVMESLGEVLEKAEMLETAKPVKLDNGYVRKNDDKANSAPRPAARAQNQAQASNSSQAAALRKSKTLKSVWRKGNPVANVQKVVKEVSKIDKEVGQSSPAAEEATKEEAPVRLPYRPQASQKAEPLLRAKPAVAPPQPPSASGAKKPAERKPILIDKFASKKAAAVPAIAQAVLTPTKPGKALPPSKLKEEWRKKGAAGGLKKRLAGQSGRIPDEDVSELGLRMSGATGARKGRKWSKASRKAARLQAARDAEPVKVEILEVPEEGMLTEELAYHLAISEAEILTYLFSRGVKTDTVTTLDKDMVKMICNEYEVEVIDAEPTKVEDMAKKKEMLDDEDIDKLVERPPVITIMGHVDHGKTTLLDHIRKSRVVASEAGGITQGIGAYKVQVDIDGKPQSCVFLDTPGHEAFGAMRARGARVTDICIIVVAADDGVRPQTSEAIAHAKAAGVPIVVAINKIDKDGANPERVMQELSTIGLMPEDWGGDVPMIKISALKGENVDDLLETVMLVAELQELKANPERNAKGTAIEAGLDKSRGPLATFIVQNGTLKKGDIVVCGEAFGKIRAMFDDRGSRVDEAGPSSAVQVIGLSNVPVAGDEFETVDSLEVARERADICAERLRTAWISEKTGQGKVTLSSIASGVSVGKRSGLDMHQLNLILKVDVQGSIEAIRHAIQVLPQDNVTLKFLLQAPGDVSTSDVDLAAAGEAIIFGFNVKSPSSVKSHADKKNVEIRLYRVIYEFIDDLRNAMEGLLDPVEEQIPIGAAGVRAVFSSGSGRVAGCMTTEGKVVKDCGIKVRRNGRIVHTGTLDSLRRVKEEVKEVGAGLECGIGMDDFDEWEAGDVIEAFNTVKKQRTLEEASATVSAALKEAGVRS